MAMVYQEKKNVDESESESKTDRWLIEIKFEAYN